MHLFRQNNRAAAVLFLVAGFLLANLLRTSHAQDTQLLKPTGHVNDFADALDAATKQRLETVLANLKEKTNLNFVVVTSKTTGSEDLYDYSLRMARAWDIGAPSTQTRSLLLIITTDNSKLFSQVSRGARTFLPDGAVGDMGRRVRERIESAGLSASLVAGIRAFVDSVGAAHDFNFAALDSQNSGDELIARKVRPRTVQTPVIEPSESPTPTPTESPTPETIESPSPQPAETLVPTPTPVETPVAPPETPTPTPVESASPTPSPAETPAPTPTPAEAPSPVEVTTPTPEESPSPSASPTQTVASNSRPARSVSNNKSVDPEDEKEEVELTLTLPLEKRIDALKAFIVARPASVAVPRAHELIVMAHALLGDKKLQASDIAGGLEQFRLAIAAAPSDMPDRLFAEVIARIPLTLFFRDQHEAAFELARQAEVLAKPRARRLVALTEFYLAIENVDEAGRLAEAALQLEPDLAQAHHALGAARHIALRLDEAEAEYARALALDPKSAMTRIALADLKRANGNFEAALALYREQLQADSKSNPARAGVVLSLLELGKKDEANTELNAVLADKEQSRNLPLLVGTAYWFMAHGDSARGLELAQKAAALEPRYSWSQIALARALVAEGRSVAAERVLRFARQYARFPTMDYELANVLASMGLYDEAAGELARSFSIKNGEIETKLARRSVARSANFIDLLAPERRAAIFQKTGVDTEANALMLKALLAFNTALSASDTGNDEILDKGQQFIKGDDGMRAFRQVYVAEKLLKRGVEFATVVELMDQAMASAEAALNVPTATVAVQPGELGEVRARALAGGQTPDVPNAPRTALSGILRARIEHLAGQALFNLDKPAEAATRLRRAVAAAPEGTPLWRAALWHLGASLEATGKNDQALLYYIKSYVHGAPDPARRSIIENVYKKVNGTLDGLDDKIGSPTGAPPKPSPSPL